MAYPPVWQMPGMMMPPHFMSPWGWVGYPPMPWAGIPAYPSSMNPGAAAAAAAAAAAEGVDQRMGGSSRWPQGKKKQRQQLVQETVGISGEGDVAADSSDDDWLPAPNQPAVDGRPTQVSKVVYKVRSQLGCAMLAFMCQGALQISRGHAGICN